MVPCLLLAWSTLIFALQEEAPSASPRGASLMELFEKPFAVEDVAENAESGIRLSTSLERHADPGRFILVYEYVKSGGAESKNRTAYRQRIHYTFTWTDLQADTIQVHSFPGEFSDDPLWLVRVAIGPEGAFIPYSNLVENRDADGVVETTGSRGKASILALAYFSEEEKARDFARALRRGLDRIASPDRGTAPAVD